MYNINDDRTRHQTRPSPPTPVINPEQPPFKRVRIRLPPSPPPDIQMSQQSVENNNQPRRSQRTNVSLVQSGESIVLPTDKVEEQHRLRSGSGWRQHDLALLKVKFEPDEDSELPMLDLEHEWSPSQRQKVDTLVQQLSYITPEILKAEDYEDYIKDHSPVFGVFFEQLRFLLTDNSQHHDEIMLPTTEISLTADAFPEQVPSNTTQSTSLTKKRPKSLTLTTSSPTKVRVTSSEYDNPQTPDRPTIPKNPAYSGDSIESTEEDNTKEMIRTLIHTTIYQLGREFRDISWPSYAKKCRLRCSGQERLRFILGRKPIIAINDGSIVVEYSHSSNRIATWGIKTHSRKINPVISIEAKRKREKGVQADWRHAGQIFSEMLGQMCQPEIYSIPPDNFLETFVIHARHTTVRLFYCKFPVSYLRNVAKHGAQYKKNVPNPQGVHLQHTKTYHLRDSISRGEFFRLLCRLISYLSSGNSHVPYLWNRDDNPINTGRWIITDDDEREYWIEEVVSWKEPIYPEEETYGDESHSPIDEESGSEFIPSETTSE